MTSLITTAERPSDNHNLTRWWEAESQTHHSADGATDSVGLELTVEATSHLVDLQGAEYIQSEQNNYRETSSDTLYLHQFIKAFILLIWEYQVWSITGCSDNSTTTFRLRVTYSNTMTWFRWKLTHMCTFSPHLSDVDLDGGMVLGSDDSVASRAAKKKTDTSHYSSYFRNHCFQFGEAKEDFLLIANIVLFTC